MIKLRDYQKEGLNAIWSYFAEGNKGNPCIAWPTGTGKSVVPAEFIRTAMLQYPNQRFLMITHVKELIAQNAEVIHHVWPNAPLGIYSAGLKQKQYTLPIVFGGIQSMIKHPALFGHRDMIWIDECFDGETEVLTENGFIRFDQLNDELIAQVGNNFIISFIKGEKIIKDCPQSPMRKIQTSIIDLHVTANHNMIIRDHSGNWKYCSTDNVVKAQYIKMATSGYGSGLETELSPYEKLAIAFQADGSLHKENSNGTAILSFSFSKQRKIDKFLELMKEGKFNWKHLDTRPAKGNVKAKKRFMIYIDEVFSKDISIYFDITKLSSIKAREIIEYMNIWDGHVASKSCYLYTTTNKKCADFYQAICSLSGYRSNLVKVEDNRSKTFSDVYRLFITKKQLIQTGTWKVENSTYNEKVYCVSVPHGAIIIRRNGKTLVTGNCHLVSQDESSMYLSFIASMRLINPNVKIVGMSATPFRMGQGYIIDEGLFTDIVHDITKLDAFNRLIAQGYMCNLIPKRTKTELDVSNVGMAKGDFIGSQLQNAVDKNEITHKGLREVVECGQNRRSWLIFASGIEHAEHIATMLNEFGIDCAPVHSKRSAEFNDQAIKSFKANQLRSIVNYSKLTTGFNHPNIDLIADFRPTMSIPLHIQKLGRGTRPAEGKKDCLILDFSRNIPRLGCINDPIIPKKKGTKEGDIPVKICENCGTYNHLKVRFCTDCGNEFQFQVKIFAKAGNAEILRSDFPVVDYFNVEKVIYTKRQKEGKLPYIQATYFCSGGMQGFNEYQFPEYNGYSRHKFNDWWKQRHHTEPPATVVDALKYIHELRMPKKIRVWLNRRYPEILSVEF